MADDGARQRSLAEKLDHLFETVHPARGEYTHQQVADAIEAAGGPTISATYLWQLRNGKRDNPTMRHLEALSGFFGVPPTYFFDDDAAERVDAELELLVSLRDASVRQLALRASGLSADSLGALVDMVERVRKLEGLPDESDESDNSAGRRGGSN
jgi:transcriptional regulator with XRE-family HTH domain